MVAFPGLCLRKIVSCHKVIQEGRFKGCSSIIFVMNMTVTGLEKPKNTFIGCIKQVILHVMSFLPL
ncbi:hypothetical protein Barb6_03479 [Bacteroidales bacterium Barb6]|nr:hypothetical protein Barb6_03479 [Bacteroidales bacterium Barb6]